MKSSGGTALREFSRRFGRDDLHLLGHYVRERRTSAGMTLQKLSGECGVSIAAIRSLETGASNPSLPTVIQVLEALGTTIDQALSAVRASRGRVVVTRGFGQSAGGMKQISEGMAEAILVGETHVLPVKTAGPLPEAMQRHASLCLVVDGALLVSTAKGERVRLGPGDIYHAEPQAVRGWDNGGPGPVRLICVADTRTASSQEGKEATA
jgi:transcriptional regulator with XRE-family HTH domain